MFRKIGIAIGGGIAFRITVYQLFLVLPAFGEVYARIRERLSGGDHGDFERKPIGMAVARCSRSGDLGSASAALRVGRLPFLPPRLITSPSASRRSWCWGHARRDLLGDQAGYLGTSAGATRPEPAGR